MPKKKGKPHPEEDAIMDEIDETERMERMHKEKRLGEEKFEPYDEENPGDEYEDDSWREVDELEEDENAFFDDEENQRDEKETDLVENWFIRIKRLRNSNELKALDSDEKEMVEKLLQLVKKYGSKECFI